MTDDLMDAEIKEILDELDSERPCWTMGVGKVGALDEVEFDADFCTMPASRVASTWDYLVANGDELGFTLHDVFELLDGEDMGHDDHDEGFEHPYEDPDGDSYEGFTY